MSVYVERALIMFVLFILSTACSNVSGSEEHVGLEGDVGLDVSEIEGKDIQSDTDEDVEEQLQPLLEIIEGDVVLAYPHQEMQLHVRVINEDGIEIEYSGVQWKSSHESVVKVINGRVIPVSIGEATVIANWNMLSDSVRVSVKKVARIEIEPGGKEVLAGDSFQLGLRYFSEDDVELFPTSSAVQWTLNAPKVGEITSGGFLTLVAGGIVKVQARSEYQVAEEVFHVDVRYTDISCYDTHCCMVSAQKDVYCWGRSLISTGRPWEAPYVEHYPARVEAAGLFKRVNVTRYGACALDLDDKLWCWGTESEGRLGTKQREGAIPHPQKVDTNLAFVDVMVQPYSTYLLDEEGELFVLGVWPPFGHVSLDEGYETYLEPMVVDSGPWTGIADVHEGMLCLYKEEEVYCIGKNQNYVFGLGELEEGAKLYYDSFVQWGEKEGVVRVSGSAHGPVCGLDKEGDVLCSSSKNTHGLMGHEMNFVDGNMLPMHYVPTRVSWEHAFEELYYSTSFTCGRNGQALGCWGPNYGCQLGWDPQSPGVIEGFNYSYVPHWPKLPLFTKVSLANNVGCVLSVEGELYCWGITIDPQLYGLYNGNTYASGSCVQHVLPVTAYKRPGM